MSIQSFLKEEQGQSMVEYGIVLGGVAAVSYIAVVMLGDRVADLYAWMANHLPGGEADDVGQVRVNGDGLVALTETGTFNSEQSFGTRNESNYLMQNTLGSNAVSGDEGQWTGDDD